MPANTSPIFILTANRGITGGARITGANTTRDLSTTGNAVILLSGGTDGTRVDAIDWVHSSSGATTSIATVGRLFQCSDTNFSNPRLIREVSLPAILPTQAGPTIGQTQTMTFTTPLFIPSGFSLVVTIGVAQAGGNYYDVTAYGGNY